MRYNASHQRGDRCFIGELADAPEQITEQTPRSFEGRRLFDALAEYRKSIEPGGWRLLHALARRDCWPAGAERLRRESGGALQRHVPDHQIGSPSRSPGMGDAEVIRKWTERLEAPRSRDHAVAEAGVNRSGLPYAWRRWKPADPAPVLKSFSK